MSSYPITALAGVDAAVATALKKKGIRTTDRLLDAACCPRGRKDLAQVTGAGEQEVLAWANMADRMRIKGMGRDYAKLLQAAGVDTVKELKYRNPERLAQAMAAANKQRKLVRILPSQKAVERWIDTAKKLPIKISY
jgi:predicted RecB family nuclease